MYEAPQVCGIVEDAVAVTLEVEWVSENGNGRSDQLAEIAVTHLGGRDCPLSKLARTRAANALVISKIEEPVFDNGAAGAATKNIVPHDRLVGSHHLVICYLPIPKILCVHLERVQHVVLQVFINVAM